MNQQRRNTNLLTTPANGDGGTLCVGSEASGW